MFGSCFRTLAVIPVSDFCLNCCTICCLCFWHLFFLSIPSSYLSIKSSQYTLITPHREVQLTTKSLLILKNVLKERQKSYVALCVCIYARLRISFFLPFFLSNTIFVVDVLSVPVLYWRMQEDLPDCLLCLPHWFCVGFVDIIAWTDLAVHSKPRYSLLLFYTGAWRELWAAKRWSRGCVRFQDSSTPDILTIDMKENLLSFWYHFVSKR